MSATCRLSRVAVSGRSAAAAGQFAFHFPSPWSDRDGRVTLLVKVVMRNSSILKRDVGNEMDGSQDSPHGQINHRRVYVRNEN